jgi:hypothetical protein
MRSIERKEIPVLRLSKADCAYWKGRFALALGDKARASRYFRRALAGGLGWSSLYHLDALKRTMESEMESQNYDGGFRVVLEITTGRRLYCLDRMEFIGYLSHPELWRIVENLSPARQSVLSKAVHRCLSVSERTLRIRKDPKVHDLRGLVRQAASITKKIRDHRMLAQSIWRLREIKEDYQDLRDWCDRKISRLRGRMTIPVFKASGVERVAAGEGAG